MIELERGRQRTTKSAKSPPKSHAKSPAKSPAKSLAKSPAKSPRISPRRKASLPLKQRATNKVTFTFPATEHHVLSDNVSEERQIEITGSFIDSNNSETEVGMQKRANANGSAESEVVKRVEKGKSTI